MGYTNIFNDIEYTHCPVLECHLYEVGCTTLLNSAATDVFKMKTVKPWNLTLSAAVEDGITIKYCFKCFGDMSIVAPTASYDNLSIRMVRNCATHIQNLTT
jgi:hypothetical protein